jgi:hypothetical protein
MQRHKSLAAETCSEPPALLKRSTYLAVHVNVAAFLILGAIALALDLPQFVRGSKLSEDALSTFLFLSPVWLGGAHYARTVIIGRAPSFRQSFHFAWKACLWLAIPVLLAKVAFTDAATVRISEVVTIAAVAVLAICCFTTFGFLNGYFGLAFALYNTALILLKMRDGIRIDPLLWFNLLGLIEVDSAFIQWSLIVVTVVLGLSERTFRLLDEPPI